VQFVVGGHLRTADAYREVIVAAGAIQSPQLLQLSGIGPANLLARFGIPVLADLPKQLLRGYECCATSSSKDRFGVCGKRRCCLGIPS
jgi:choline dehydrogenase-like flavoprotein